MAQNKNFTIKNYTGTDYNILHPKTTSGQSLLDKSAQTTTGLASGATLNDALQDINKDGGIYQIGDTLTTSRTDLGDKWLLCNGQAISNITYPELASLLPSVYDFNWVSMGTMPYAPKEFATDDNVFLISTGSSLYTSNTLDGGWTKLYDNVNTAKRFGGNFIATSVNHSTQCVYWTSNNISSETAQKINGLTSGVEDITYHDNYYFAYHNVTDSTLQYCNMYIWYNLSNSPSIVKLASWYESSSVNKLIKGPWWDLPDGVGLQLNTDISNTSTTVRVMSSGGSVMTYNITFPKLSISSKPSSVFAIYFSNKYYLFIKELADRDYDVYVSDSLTSGYKKLFYNSTAVKCSNATKINNILVLGGEYYIDTEGTVHAAKNPRAASTPVVIGTNNFYIANNKNAYRASARTVIHLPKVSQSNGLYTYIKAKL